LDNYIDIAKSELTNMSQVLEDLQSVIKAEAIEKEKDRLFNLFKNGEISSKEYISKIETL